MSECFLCARLYGEGFSWITSSEQQCDEARAALPFILDMRKLKLRNSSQYPKLTEATTGNVGYGSIEFDSRDLGPSTDVYGLGV